MEEEEMLGRAADRAGQLPSAELTHPFGEDWDVWKVKGRVFMLQPLSTDSAQVIVKADPSDAVALREMYPFVVPGYHMNKRHWVSILADGALDEELLDDMVTESYLLVVEKMPTRQRPVDPATWAGRER